MLLLMAIGILKGQVEGIRSKDMDNVGIGVDASRLEYFQCFLRRGEVKHGLKMIEVLQICYIFLI